MAGLKKRAAWLTAMGVLAAGAALLPATAAQAKPGTCSGVLDGNTYKAICLFGSGQYRAYVDCWKIRGNTYVARKGPWRSPITHLWSSVSCVSGEEPGTHFAELRN